MTAKLYRKVCQKCGRVFYAKYKVTNLCFMCRSESECQVTLDQILKRGS